MRKLIAFVLLVMVALNVAVMVSAKPKGCEEPDRKCAAVKLPKLELTNLNPGFFPGLLKF